MSALFRVAAAAGQKTAMKAWKNTSMSKLASALGRADMQALNAIGSKGLPPTARKLLGGKSVQKLARDFLSDKGNTRAMMEKLEQAMGANNARKMRRQGNPVKYAMDEISKAGMQAVFKQMGPLGGILRLLIEESGKGTEKQTTSQLQAATELLRAFGHEVIPPAKAGMTPGRRRGLEAAAQALQESGVTRPASRIDEVPQYVDERIRAIEEEVRTPHSSNVYSFTYIQKTKRLGDMFVTFQAPRLKGSKTRTTKLAGGIVASPGAFAGGGTGKRGAMYKYSDVPVGVYRTFRSKARSSAGKAVWDELRIRGTIEGHQYTYQLVDAATIVQNDVAGQYIPRRATAKGFVERTLAVPGTEMTRRPRYWTSSLPDRAFPDRAAPNRGLPNTGAPQTGAPSRV